MAGLRAEEDGLSPVIGVIMMVAVTTVLISTIAIFVFDVSETVEPTAEAEFAFTYDGGTGELTIRHEGGNRFDGDQLYVRGENIGAVDGQTWGALSSRSRIVTGTTITFSVPADYEVRVVFENDDESNTLDQNSGPAA